MAGSAYIHVVGNVGGDPEIREAGRNDICSFSVAVNVRRGQDDVTTWFRCNVWGTKGQGLLDVADRYIRKGMQLSVHGDFSLSEWEDRDGNTRTTAEINVRGFVLGNDGGGDRGSSSRRDDDRDRGRGRDERRGASSGRDRGGRDGGRDDDRRGGRDDRDRSGGRDDRRGSGSSSRDSGRGSRDNDLDDEIPF